MFRWDKVFVFISFLIGEYQLCIAQQHKCGYATYYQNIIKEYPEILSKEIVLQNDVEHNNQRIAQSEGIIRIPVVIHVLYNTESQNISDEQIKSQISALNRDYRALNTDKLPSNHQFYDRIGDTEIEFCIATVVAMVQCGFWDTFFVNRYGCLLSCKILIINDSAHIGYSRCCG